MATKTKKSTNVEKKEEKKIGVKPLGDRVVVRPEKFEEKTAGGIIIPDTARQEKPEKGFVVAVGEGKMSDDGRVLPMRVKVGDKVMFSKYGYDEVKIDGEDYFIVSESTIVAILK
ncbi:MAG: co-chaperone GroES [Parcubacteria group bacterium]|nr:co-chaperone GroES [Parcubacteria group bacterium]